MSFQWHIDPEQMIIDLKKKIERLTTRVNDHVLLQSEYIERIAELEAKLRETKINLCKWNHDICDFCECGYSRPTDTSNQAALKGVSDGN